MGGRHPANLLKTCPTACVPHTLGDHLCTCKHVSKRRCHAGDFSCGASVCIRCSLLSRRWSAHQLPSASLVCICKWVKPCNNRHSNRNLQRQESAYLRRHSQEECVCEKPQHAVTAVFHSTLHCPDHVADKGPATHRQYATQQRTHKSAPLNEHFCTRDEKFALCNSAHGAPNGWVPHRWRFETHCVACSPKIAKIIGKRPETPCKNSKATGASTNKCAKADRKVFDQASTSSSLGGKATLSAALLPCVIIMYFVQCFTPDLKLASDFGQLPNTAATLALPRQAARCSGSAGMLASNNARAAKGFAPETSMTSDGAAVSSNARFRLPGPFKTGGTTRCGTKHADGPTSVNLCMKFQTSRGQFAAPSTSASSTL